MALNNQNKTIYFLLFVIILQSVFLIASCQKKAKPTTKEKIPRVIKPKEIEKPKQPETAKEPEKKKEPQAIIGKIAIVLDDWGYNKNHLKTLEEIEGPLTLAVLPNVTFSQAICRRARELKKEIILHLPLEPKNEAEYSLEKNTILTTMTREQIINILNSDFKSTPGLKGVSNHMGSKATEDERLMRIIFTELKKQGFYFLDSYTSKTICKNLSSSMNMPYIQRHVFLDNDNDYGKIKLQLERLARIAKQQGYAVGIGHDRLKTLQVLKELMPQLKKQGFKFVYVSELIN